MRSRAWAAATVAFATGAMVVAGCGGGASPNRTEPPATSRDVVTGCPPGTHPDRAGPAGQARPEALQGMLSAAVDADSARLVVLAAVRVDKLRTRPETWTLDLCTNTWQRQHPTDGPSAAPDTQLVYDAADDVVIAWSPRERVSWAYDVVRDEWTRLAAAPAAPQGALQDVVYDPTGRRVILRDGSDGRLWSYRFRTDSWRALAGTSATGDDGTDESDFHSYLVADPARHQLILVQNSYTSPARTWRFDLDTRRWTRYPTATPDVINGYDETGGEIVFDPGADRALLLGYARLVAFDPGAGTWREVTVHEPLVVPESGDDTSMHTGPLVRTRHTLVYDPVNARVLVVGGMYHRSEPSEPFRWTRSRDVWAYETANDTWTELVAP
ncbi:MAG TPA: hypothetical protein VHO29_01640 [Marmoricola sp.]|nr:hypothetical protein [Marmoricola sp.]